MFLAEVTKIGSFEYCSFELKNEVIVPLSLSFFAMLGQEVTKSTGKMLCHLHLQSEE